MKGKYDDLKDEQNAKEMNLFINTR